MKVEIYSDIACPWCYIGERRFARALSAYPKAGAVDVVFRSYQLDADAPTSAVPLTEYLEKRYGQSAAQMLGQVSDAGEDEGIEFDWGRAVSVNTLDAHRLLRLAEHEYGAKAQRDLAERLFASHFTDGGDIGDHRLLKELAVDAGLDGARVEAYLASDEGLEATRSEIEDARALGVTAVPTFVFNGKYAVQGAQSASIFLQALEQVDRESQAAAPESSGEDDDACADGSCAI